MNIDLTPTPDGRFRINPCDRIEWYDRKEQRYLIVCDEDAVALRDLLIQVYGGLGEKPPGFPTT